jgi:phage-related protein
MTYTLTVASRDKPLAWLHGEIKTPPLGKEARLEAGFLLRRLQRGELLSMPQSRPMPSIGARCHELRINDTAGTWRIMYRIDKDAIVILEVFAKKTRQTPAAVIATCRRRLKEYDSAGR